MLFNSYTFIVFLLVVVIAHNFILKDWTSQKIFLLIASYLFYAAWNPVFVILIWISTVIDWWVARWMYHTVRQSTRRLILLISLIANLGFLGFFKYGQFLLDNLVEILALVGIHYQPAAWNIVLPVGISFYTFQTLSYTIDVYRREIVPKYSLLDFALYVVFFPQLVAGPIVRASYFLPQCLSPRRANLNQLGWGMVLIVIGLFEKIVLADSFLAPVVDQIYAMPLAYQSEALWTGVLAFSGQIFFDFSGYSTIAIGSALCLGFSLPDNFRFPYAALGFSDFWRRWHISLSTWLRDYLYIPLGGNRGSVRRTHVNLMITMLLGGLWHGASWLFVLWGGLHGLYLVIERLVRDFVQRSSSFNALKTQDARVVMMLMTFIVVTLTWIPFRSTNIPNMFAVMKGLFSDNGEQELLFWQYVGVLLTITVTFLWQIYARDQSLETIAERTHWLAKAFVLLLMILGIVVFSGGDERAFIYFQF